jgi:hypothetical protein
MTPYPVHALIELAADAARYGFRWSTRHTRLQAPESVREQDRGRVEAPNAPLLSRRMGASLTPG